MPGPDAEALVLPRGGEGTAGTLQRSASMGTGAVKFFPIPFTSSLQR